MSRPANATRKTFDMLDAVTAREQSMLPLADIERNYLVKYEKQINEAISLGMTSVEVIYPEHNLAQSIVQKLESLAYDIDYSNTRLIIRW